MKKKIDLIIIVSLLFFIGLFIFFIHNYNQKKLIVQEQLNELKKYQEDINNYELEYTKLEQINNKLKEKEDINNNRQKEIEVLDSKIIDLQTKINKNK